MKQNILNLMEGENPFQRVGSETTQHLLILTILPDYCNIILQ